MYWLDGTFFHLDNVVLMMVMMMVLVDEMFPHRIKVISKNNLICFDTLNVNHASNPPVIKRINNLCYVQYTLICLSYEW